MISATEAPLLDIHRDLLSKATNQRVREGCQPRLAAGHVDEQSVLAQDGVDGGSCKGGARCRVPG